MQMMGLSLVELKHAMLICWDITDYETLLYLRLAIIISQLIMIGPMAVWCPFAPSFLYFISGDFILLDLLL